MTEETLVPLVWLIPALPLASFFLIFLFARGRNAVEPHHRDRLGGGAHSCWRRSCSGASSVIGAHLAEHPIANSFAWLPTA